MGGHGGIHTPPEEPNELGEWSIPAPAASRATWPRQDPEPEGLALTGDPAKWKIFSVVGFALFMSSLDLTIVSTALPAIHRSLHSPINWTAWTITAATLGTVVIMPIAGGISDQFGRKRVFIVSAVVFTLASLACGFAGNIYLLVVLRAFQALGGGAFMPSATGIVADSFGPNRDRAIAMFTSILPVGAIAGPVLGGVFVTYWSWRGIFFINIPIGIAVIAAAIRYLPKSPRRQTGNLDLYGIFLLGSTVLVSMYAVTLLGEAHADIGSPEFIGSLVVAGLLTLAFVRNTLRNPFPIIPLYLLKGRAFLIMDLVNLIYGAAVLGLGALVPLYAEDRFHIAPLQAGTVLAARAVGTIAVAGIASFLLRRTGFRLPMIVGMTIIGIGSAMMFFRPSGVGPFVWLSLTTGFTGIGMGAAMPAANNATLSFAAENVAAITGMRGMFRSIGSIVAVSIMTAIASRSLDPGIILGWGFVLVGIPILIVIPLIASLEDHRGNW
ncbi:MAG TPA: MFS transporter [Acidimicrobiales bacterium]|nr:MFS transporter [Acidimicrobiales bacterium]